MDLGWLEFSVILGCGLAGFFVVNAFLERRQLHKESSHQKDSETNTEQPRENASKSAQAEGCDSQRSWWEVLGVSRQASPDDIKVAFRKEIARYHPDRVEGLGTELRELAEQKAKEINCAYSAAKTERGFC